MPVNPAYRDFFKALDAMESGAGAWAAYEELYLRPHEDVMRAYWHQVWRVSEETIPELIRQLRPADYQGLRPMLEATDIDGLARQALSRCARLIDLPEPQVDLLVGRFSPDAFLFTVNSDWHIGIGLERFASFANLPLFIAHEYGHYARRMLAAEPRTLGDRIIAEGIAVAFAEAAYPESRLARHLRMTPRRIHEIREAEPGLWQALKPHLTAAEGEDLSGILYGAQRWMGFPPRFGGVLGYWAVRHFARAHGQPVTSRSTIAAESQAVIDAYLACDGH
jgi:hypothetical protein